MLLSKAQQCPSQKLPFNRANSLLYVTRLRTLVKYGMTVSQVAEVYQVPIETIERMIRKT
jgi:hypothetical protein